MTTDGPTDQLQAEAYTPRSSESQQQAARKLAEAQHKQSTKAQQRKQTQNKARYSRPRVVVVERGNTDCWGYRE